MKNVFIFVFALMLLGAGCSLKPSVPEDFSSQEECQKYTGKACGYAVCDFIPEGMTFEEACGKDFKKGWVPVNK